MTLLHASPRRAAVSPISGRTAVVAAIAALPLLAALAVTPAAHALVALSLGGLGGAAIASVIAWRMPVEDSSRFGAWDLAGVFAFVGFGAGMIARPETVLKVFGLS